MARILIVDDDPAIQEILSAYLLTEGHTVIEAISGDAALPLMARADLAILDWMLPGLSGLEIATEARARGLELPILMLSARIEEEDKLRGLAIGIDDYVVKPFSPREVLARVRVLLRRVGVRHETRSGELLLDTRSRRVTLSGEGIELSRLEYDLLVTLAQHPGFDIARPLWRISSVRRGIPQIESVSDIPSWNGDAHGCRTLQSIQIPSFACQRGFPALFGDPIAA